MKEQPTPPPVGGGMGGAGGGLDIPGGIGGSPLPTGGPGAGPGTPPPSPAGGGGMGGVSDMGTSVPPKEIKTKNIWNILEKILSEPKNADSKNTGDDAKLKQQQQHQKRQYKYLRR